MTSLFSENTGIPKYLQLKDTLVERIRKGQYRQGDKFLTERGLMKEFGLSSATVSHAMREMAADGFIIRKVGGGTFITGTSPLAGKNGMDAGLTLLINNLSQSNIRNYDDLNWFIMSEIKRGITNTFPGRTKIISTFELFNEVETSANNKVILINPAPPDIRKLNQKNIDYIIINQDGLCGSEYNCVNLEQMHGVYEAMSYLIKKLGHRNIAMITRGLTAHKDRYAAYKISLETYDIPFSEDLVVNTEDGTEAAGYKAMRKLLDMNDRPTAVFVDTDIKALGAFNAVRDSGLRNPEDISLLGFDDIPGIEKLCPLTTVRVPYYEMGETAVNLLYDKIAEEKSVMPSVTMETKLIIRNSCAPVSGEI